MKRYGIVIILIFALIIFCQVPYTLWEGNAELVLYPPPSIVLTAEYLYANPLPTPTDHSFSPAPSIIVYQNEMVEYGSSLCVNGEQYIVWIINGKNPPSEMYDDLWGIFPILDDTPEWTKEFVCFEYPNRLPIGIHLIEVRFGMAVPYSPSFLPVESYQWAFKIVPSLPTLTPTP